MTDLSLLQRSWIVWFGAIVLATAGPLSAAEIRGRLVHRDAVESSELAGLEVRAVGIIAGGDTLVRETKSDAEGRFEFSDLRVPGAYLVVADYLKVGFHADGVRFDSEADADATREVEIQIHRPTQQAAAIELENIRLLVEQEAGAYRFDHQIGLNNTGDRVVVLDPEQEPPIQLALVAGHQNMVAGDGIEHRDFELRGDRYVLVGPVYPGRRVARIRYEVPVDGTSLDARLPFAQTTPEFELYILDEGISVDVGPLHPARIARDEAGSSYLHYLGFDLAPGSEVPLRISPRVRIPPSNDVLIALLAALLGAGLVYVVGRPLLSSQSEVPQGTSSSEPESQALELALRDLEYDFETGKLSAEDRDELRQNLEHDAAALSEPPKPQRPAPKQLRCPECERTVQAEDRFCSSCGTAL